ncbi:Stp1/IreP family PP2C-type Ser/Thr phosphatase [Noviherbaspirillum autotrophicum]|uniref:Protein phosphatase n=1 Tax=Noviherbaspirillum autotrophicum TaxID=709839 RepID=A0A0C1YMF4_9BURK|nr:Stp1/IreP family PP2C-type Ser/Thr phosphatase [Noviherbaspirillum autotrophicum]KIF81727.1 protein phosphatase [Noviherbaspirillum autotrophicum]
MAHHLRLEFAAKTDTGLVRSHNEDCVAISPEHGFAILADGMGGYQAGEVASGIATAVLKKSLEEGLARLSDKWPHLQGSGQVHQLMDEAIHRANNAILEAARTESRYEGMGTTLVAALFRGDTVTIAHVGDSRAYRLRQGDLLQITKDHSLLQEQLDAGLISPEWARFSAIKNLVTRAVGVGPDMEVEMRDHHVEAGDLYLLCSDGLSDMLAEQEISEILLENKRQPLNNACGMLVQKANDNGGRDNISVILINVLLDSPQAGSLLDRVLHWFA